MDCKLKQLLYCDRCNSGFKQSSEEMELKCKCRTIPVVKNVPRFVKKSQYAENFGFEWLKFQKTQLDSHTGSTHTANTFFTKTGWSLEDFSENDLILDVGCGAGRFIEVIAETGATIIGVDVSQAVEAAYDNVGHYPNVHILQADVFDLPFKKESFDKIYSIGVLHHTPSTQQAFEQLPPLLKPAGELAIWVYRKIPFAPKSLTHLVRWLFTSKMNYEQLISFSKKLDKHWYPIVKKIKWGDTYPLRSVLMTSVYPDAEWRVLNNFDSYSPQYNHQHTFSEVVSWFKKARLKDVQPLSVSTAVKGKR